MGHGIADRGDGRPAARLADPETGPVRPRVDELHGHLRHLAKAQNGVALPVARADAVCVEPHPFLERPAGAMNDAALELVDGTIRVDHEATIRRTPHADETHTLVDRNL